MSNVRPYGRSVAIFISFLMVVIFLTYRSFIDTVFYANWISGIAIIVISSILVLFRRSFSATGIITLFVSSAWIFFAVFVTAFATDVQNHLKILTVSSFYSLASVMCVDTLFRSKIDLSRVFYSLLVAWFLVNIILLFLYFIEFYIPVGNAFSGVFHDRNVFSITTLIVLSFALPFYDCFSRKKKGLLILMVLSCTAMVLISKSITGLVGLFCVFSFFVVNLKKKKKYKIAFILLIYIFGSIVFLTDNPLKKRIDRFVLSASGQSEQLYTNESAYIRMYLLINGAQLSLANPVTGVGLDNARFHVVLPGNDRGSFLHNTYLDILTSGGVLMFVLYYIPKFYILIWLVLKRKIKSEFADREKNLWNAALLMLILNVIYDFTWTTYFEFGLIFSVNFSIYTFFKLKKGIAFEKSSLHSQYPQDLRSN